LESAVFGHEGVEFPRVLIAADNDEIPLHATSCKEALIEPP
jgi:hypothetical protein